MRNVMRYIQYVMCRQRVSNILRSSLLADDTTIFLKDIKSLQIVMNIMLNNVVVIIITDNRDTFLQARPGGEMHMSTTYSVAVIPPFGHIK